MRGVFASFHERHNEEFGYTLPEDLAELEIVNARVHAEGHREEPPDPRFAGKPDRVPKPVAHRKVFFDGPGWVETPIYQRDRLPTGYEITGPAIIEQLDSTTVLDPTAGARVDGKLNLICATG